MVGSITYALYTSFSIITHPPNSCNFRIVSSSKTAFPDDPDSDSSKSGISLTSVLGPPGWVS